MYKYDICTFTILMINNKHAQIKNVIQFLIIMIE